MDFDSLPADPAPAQAAQAQAGPMNFDSLPDDNAPTASISETPYGIHANVSPGVAGGILEAGARGLIGHTLTALGEKGLTSAGVPGFTPEEQAQREEQLKSVSPVLPAAAEAAGFGAGMFTGASEAKLTGAIGEAALQAAKLAHLTKDAALTSKLAAGAVRTGSELAALQADDEISKAINGNSKGVGDAITNIGLAAALGGATGGVFTGVGTAAKGALDAVGLKEFADRLAFRGANVHPNEMIEKEFNDAIEQYHSMNSELGGAQGLRSQALAKIMPEEVTPEIGAQIQTIADKAKSSIGKMVNAGVPDRYIKKFTVDLNDLQEVLTDPKASVGNMFDAMNGFKKSLQDYSKGNWGPFAVPSYHEAYDFLNITKGLGHDVRMALEDPAVWGKVGELQKSLNSSWSKILPAVKDVQSKFMEKVGGEYVPSPQKFSTYVNQNGRATTQTIRQQMMGNFVDAAEKHFNAVDAAYRAAGVENPFPAPGLGALKESLKKTSIGSRLADLWYDRLTPEALGSAAGAAVGEAVASQLGAPGLGGLYVGKEVLGKLFGSIIKPVAEKVSNLSAYQGAMRFVKETALGQQKLVNASANLFKAGAKTLPNHWIPDAKQLLKLDEKLKAAHDDQASLMNSAGDLPHYLPQNAQMMTRTAMNAVNTLNAARPSNPKTGVFDSEIPPSKAQEADYQRKLAIAEQPLMVLHHIGEGTLTPSDVATLNSLYPEYYEKMRHSVMAAMMEHAHDGGAVPYRIRQGLSVFLAQPLDSTMTPQSIMAIQTSFAQNAPQQPQGGAGKSKGSTAKLGKVATNMQTITQAREARQNS